MSLPRRCLTLLLIGALHAPPAQAQDGYFTINGNDLKVPSPLRDTHLTNIAAAGVGAVRAGVAWNVVEPAAGTYRWAGYDGFVAALARHGLTWRPLLAHSPAWNRLPGGDWNTRPADPSAAAGITSALLLRYGPGGTFWTERPDLSPHPVRWIEAWNEPNFSPSGPLRYPPAEYAGFLRAVADGAHAVDPGAEVIVGGLVPHSTTTARGMSPREFLNAVAAADPTLPARVQGVATHVFGTNAADVARVVRGVRDQLAATPFASSALHLNETGGPVLPTDVAGGEAIRAAFLEDLPPQLACDVASIAPYAWTTAETDPADPEHWFGLAHPDGTLRPSAEAFARSIATTTAARRECGRAQPPVAAAAPAAAALPPASSAPAATPPSGTTTDARPGKRCATRKRKAGKGRRCGRATSRARTHAAARRRAAVRASRCRRARLARGPATARRACRDVRR